MTTGTIFFLTLIAALVLVLGVAVIWQCCDIRSSITEFKKEPSSLYYNLLRMSGCAFPYISPLCDDELREEIYKKEILRRLRRPKQPEPENTSKSSLCNRHPEYYLSLLDSDSTQGLRGCMEDLCKIYGIPAHLLVRGMHEVGKELNLKSGTIFKSSLSPESATSKGAITPPSSLSDVELRKYCIEQTNKDQVYLRIEDAQRLYEYILNGRQERKEESNGKF